MGSKLSRRKIASRKIQWMHIKRKDQQNRGAPRIHLGPLLFLIYINDITRAGQEGELLLFADDANYYESSPDYSVLIDSIYRNLKYLSKWFISNKLTINIIKSEATLFSRKILYFPIQPVLLNDSPIPFNYTFKFLGLYLDFKLNWKYHVHQIRSKLSSACGILYKIRNMVTRQVAKIIYYGIAHPYLNYCNIVWASCYPTAIQPLISIQKKLIRLIVKKNRRAHSIPLFHQLKILQLTDLNKLNTALFVYKSLNNHISSPINFQIRNVEGYNLRNQQNIAIPIHSSRQSELFVHVRGARLWGEIPIEIRNKSSVNSFKYCLKKHYLEMYRVEHQSP